MTVLLTPTPERTKPTLAHVPPKTVEAGEVPGHGVVVEVALHHASQTTCRVSNTWRPDSEANTSSALIRTGEGFVGRMCSNAFEEFWPDVSHYLFPSPRYEASGSRHAMKRG
jgi:hypothetical protein